MTGKATISYEQYLEAVKALTALDRNIPTVKELQKNLGRGSTALLGKYRIRHLYEQQSVPQTATINPALRRAIEAEMLDVSSRAVESLNETLRAERELARTDFENIEVQNAENAQAHSDAMDEEREKTRRASVLVEERAREIDRLRADCVQFQEAGRLAESERIRAMSVGEADRASIERERRANEATLTDLKTDLKAERESRHQSERDHSVSQQLIATLEQKNIYLQQENLRLQKSEDAAAKVPALIAVNDTQLQQITDLQASNQGFFDMDRTRQEELSRLNQEVASAQQQRNAYKVRADLAESMHSDALAELEDKDPGSPANQPIDLEL